MTRFDVRAMRGGIFGFFSDSKFEGSSSGTGQTFISESDSSTIIPSFNLVQPFKDKWWFGFTVLGVGFSDDFGEDWAGRYLIQDYSLAYISAYPSIATKLTDKLSVAGSLMLTYTVYEQNKAVLNLDPGFDDGSLNLDADGWTGGFSFSMLYEFNDRTRFGAVYRSELDPDLDADLNFSNLSPTTEAALDAAGLLTASSSVSSRLAKQKRTMERPCAGSRKKLEPGTVATPPAATRSSAKRTSSLSERPDTSVMM